MQPIKVKSTGTPKLRHGGLNEFGWGLRGRGMFYMKDSETHLLDIPSLPRPKVYVNFNKKARQYTTIDQRLNFLHPVERVNQNPEDYPAAVIDQNFVESLQNSKIEFTNDFHERLHRSICQTFVSLMQANFGKVDRIVDLVVFPSCHAQVVKIVELANLHNVILLPIGGSTNVSESTCHPNSQEDQRSVVVVDCTQMNRLMWLDETNMLACFEAGIAGRDLENFLNEKGYTFGHEPDSMDFSTLGGWISTRASGMKRQKYGNIEECVKDFKFVTSAGVLSKLRYPRVSHGPTIRDLVFGSEGTLGIITEATVRIYQRPKVTEYGSIIFPTFEHGIKFMYEISKTEAVPASLRLVDNFHYGMSQVVKETRGFLHDSMIEPVKRGYLWYVKGFDEKKIAIATYKMEGDERSVKMQSDTIDELAVKNSGVIAGAHYGLNAYNVTFLIGYMRVSRNFIN